MEDSRGKKKKESCTSCGARLAPGKSQCISCGAWNFGPKPLHGDETVLLADVVEAEHPRYVTGPWDPCFGGGVTKTSVTLFAGEPGAGKSTISLQMAMGFTQHGVALYICAEEDPRDVKARAIRLGATQEQLKKIRAVYALGGFAGDLGPIMLEYKPVAIFLDSLPGLMGDNPNPDDSVQLASRFKAYAVELNAPVIIVDHVTKDDDYSGRRALQHAVDTTIIMFAEDDGFREMTTTKNRFAVSAGRAQVRLFMTSRGIIHPKDVTQADLDAIETARQEGEDEEDVLMDKIRKMQGRGKEEKPPGERAFYEEGDPTGKRAARVRRSSKEPILSLDDADDDDADDDADDEDVEGTGGEDEDD